LRPTARNLARIIPVPRGIRPRPLDLSECPHCSCSYVQPGDWKTLPDGRVSHALRCPECMTWMSGTFPPERVRELDRVVVSGRAELKAVYGRTVRDNMYRELQAFSTALELDLIDAGDFVAAQAAAQRLRSYH
jgi:hypothetical protein